MSDFAQQLREQTAAVRLQRTKFGTSKAYNKEQKERAANVFGAAVEATRGGKRLLNTKHEKYREVTKVLSHATETWVYFTTPYTETGVRLIRRDRVDEFNLAMQRIVGELDQAVAGLNEVYREIVDQARADLGDLYNSADYPETLEGKYSISWDFPNVEPPAYLKDQYPAIYRAEQERIRARFEEAVALAEQSFADEFQQLVGSITTSLLVPDKNGVQRSLQEKSVDNLRAFFDRFKMLNINSNEALDSLIEQAKDAVAGKTAATLNSNILDRYVVGESLRKVQEQVESMFVARPRRAFLVDEQA